MTSTEPHPDISIGRPDDPQGEELLLQAVRDGSTAAYGILYARYRPFAVNIALRALSRPEASMAEDVAEVSFIRVLTALRNGKGPTDTLRSYLTTTVRREAWRAQRRGRRQAEVVDLWAADEVLSAAAEDDMAGAPAGGLGTHMLLSEAFEGLSDRWRHVLWLTEVEGRKPTDLAPMLGVSPGTASALAYRARNGLIAAYVAAYRRTTTDEACIAISEQLGAYVAAGSAKDRFPDVVAHLDGCRACREVSRGVDVLGSTLAGFVPFGLLTVGWWAKAATAGSAGLAGVGAGAAVGGTGVGTAASGAGGPGAGAGAGAGGLGALGTAAAAVSALVAMVAIAGAAYAGIVRSDDAPSASPPPADQPVASGAAPSSSVKVEGSTLDRLPEMSSTTVLGRSGASTTSTMPPIPTPRIGCPYRPVRWLHLLRPRRRPNRRSHRPLRSPRRRRRRRRPRPRPRPRPRQRPRRSRRPPPHCRSSGRRASLVER